MIGTLIVKRKSAEGFEALNRRDLDTYLKDWAEEAVLVFPGDIPGMSGVFTGKEAIRAWYQRDFEQFPTTRRRLKSVAVSNLFDMTGDNMVAVHWDFEGTSRNGAQIENSGVSMITIKGGKVTHIHIYVFDTGEKFRAAWK